MIEAGDERVIVWAPRGRDGKLAVEVMSRRGFTAVEATDVTALCAAIEEGAGCAVITEESLTPHVLRRLGAALAGQPAWSDFPLLIFGATRHGSDPVDFSGALGNVTYLDRPVRIRTILGAIRTALRGRRRQYAARAAIARRDEFLAMLGHELRNPLAAIVFAGEMAARTADSVERGRQSAIIDRQARHLCRLVDDLLDVSRVTRGKVELRRESVDLVTLAEHAVQQVEAAAVPKGHVLGVRTDLERLVIDGDPVRFEQILSNLLTNAIKYTPHGGHIEVEVARESSEAVLRVRDDGIGIDPAMASSIFEPFAQAASAIDRRDGGLGLGLTLVRSLVRMHGGEVSAHSDGVGLGSVFEVRLPAGLNLVQAGTHRGARLTSPSLDVVLVDDNEDMREMMVAFLRAAGHRVEDACDGVVGLSTILARRPDVAIVDIGLPGLDGFEVARKVRAELGEGIRLVAITGYGQPDDRARSGDAGYDVHLVKPTSPDELLASLSAGP
jgi:signal transduction histidine kinase/CheY-like chemotaxis protein